MTDLYIKLFLAQHLSASRQTEAREADIIADYMYRIAVGRRIPMESVVDWIYASTERADVFEFGGWAKEVQGVRWAA